MQRIITAIFILVALVAATCGYTRPQPGEITAIYETDNQVFRIRVNQHAEKYGGLLAGAYYVFQSAPVGSEQWRDVMTFRHDDPNPIPQDQIRFVDERIGYVFMGWMYAITTDGGSTWLVWDAKKDLPNWQCCNYGLIKDVKIMAEGKGRMSIRVISKDRGEVPELLTSDYGKHWSVTQ